MNLYGSRIQAERLNLDPYDLLELQLLENSIQHAALGPPVHPRVNRMPVTKALWQPTPLTSVLGHIQQRIYQLQIAQAYVPTLHRQAIFDSCELLFRDLHLLASLATQYFISVNTP